MSKKNAGVAQRLKAEVDEGQAVVSEKAEELERAGVITLLASASSAYGAVSGLRKVQDSGDKLVLANAIAKALVALTGILIGVRAMRKGR